MATRAPHSYSQLSFYQVDTVALNTTHLVARLLWIPAVLLILLFIHQVNVALDLRKTRNQGTPATADILAYESSDRVDVTYGYVNLRVAMPDGTVIERRKMSLPTTLLPRVKGAETLQVHVQPGADQEIVIDRLMPAQWLIAAAQAAMSLMGALLIGIGVFSWNRYLEREGDPAQRELSEEEQTAAA